MKIAIPTSDEIHVAQNLHDAIGYLVFTTQFGEIVDEEYRLIAWGDMLGKHDDLLTSLDDCNMLICSEHDPYFSNQTNWSGDVFKTKEKIITNVILLMLDKELVDASNHLCCP